DDLLDAVCGKPYRTTMDMGQGFHQIPIDPKSREITAVTTHRGLYEYHRMPMGLKNAPSHFCRVMHDVLAGLEWICTYTYLDDVTTASETLQRHKAHLREVLTRFRERDMTVDPKKLHVLEKVLKFLGHVVTVDGIRMDYDKVRAVVEMDEP